MATLEQVRNQAYDIPGGVYDPVLIKQYQSLGGTLSNGAIPKTTLTPTGTITATPTQVTPVTTIKSSDGQKAVQEMQEKANALIPPPTAPKTATTTPEKDLVAESLAKEDLTPEEKLKLETTQRAAQRTQETKDFIVSLGAQLESSKAAMLVGIGESYNRIIQQTEEASKRYEATVGSALIRSGGGVGGAQRYTPEISSGIFQAAVNEGLQRVADIIGKRNEAIASVNASYSEKKFSLMAEQFDRLNKINDDLDKTLSEIAETQREKSEELNKQLIQSSRDDAVASLISQGITDPLQLMGFLNFNEKGQKIGDFTFKEVYDISSKIKSVEGEKLQSYIQEWKEAVSIGAVPEGTSLFEYHAQKDPGKALSLKKLGLDIQKLEADLRGTSGDNIIATPQGQAISDAVRTLKFPTVADRKDAEAFIRDLVADGRIPDAKEALLSYVQNSSAETERAIVSGKDDAVRQLQRIQDSLNTFVEKNGDTNIFTGLSESALQKVGTTLDPELAIIANDIAIAIIDYRRAVSGAAFTESEAKAYAGVFPSVGKTPELNKAKITSLITKFEDDKDNYLKRKIGDRKYAQIFGETSVTPEQDATLSDDEAWDLYLQMTKE